MSETGNVFLNRVAAYNDMNEALRKADTDQKQLDRTRLETFRQKSKTNEVLDGRVGGKKKRIPERTLILAQREEEADELLALIG